MDGSVTDIIGLLTTIKILGRRNFLLGFA